MTPRAHAEAQLHQVRALDLRERVEGKVWLALEEAVAAAHLPARVANAAWDAFFGRSVTPRYYRPLADVSPATATNDLAAAVAAALGIPVDEPGDVSTAIIIGELARRAAADGPR